MARQPLPHGRFKNDPDPAFDIDNEEAWGRTDDNFIDVYSQLSQIVSAGEARFAHLATIELRIQAGADTVVAELKKLLFIPAQMFGFDINQINLTAFNAAAARIVREGGDFSVYDVQAYGADEFGVLDAGPSWNKCRANIPAAGGVMRVPPGVYNLVTAFTFGTHNNVTLIIDPGVTLLGEPLPNALRADNNQIIDYRSGFSVTNRITIPIPTTVTPNLGPLAIDAAEAIFNGASDPILYMGYNQAATGSPIVGTEPAAAWAIEGNFNDGSGQNKMEAYVQFLATDGAFRRPFFASYNRVTKTCVPTIDGDRIQFTRAVQSENVAHFFNDGVNGNELKLFACAYAANTTLLIEAAATNTAILKLSRAALAGLEFWVAGPTLAQVRLNNRDTAFFFANPQGSPGDCFSVGANDNSAVGLFNNTGPASIKGVVARGKSGQTGFLFEAQSSASATLWAITAAGNMQIGANQVVGPRGAAVADATDATSAITQLNALLARVRAHGLIAP